MGQALLSGHPCPGLRRPYGHVLLAAPWLLATPWQVAAKASPVLEDALLLAPVDFL